MSHDIENLNKDITKLEDGTNLLVNDVETVLHNSMMPYAEYVIMDRAIPRVEDGLKPVQRRILYAMYDLGLTPDKPYKKSARIVGECLGKYHPHGDSSVYNAMVRMAQPFNLNAPLVEGQGNFGSIDGDSAAAMRYTEARLSELAMELLKDIDKDTVRWSRNFDDSTKEPDILPGRFPNLLVNGASGIAVGLATNIPPHNLAEVVNGVIAYIDNSNISLATLMKYIPGPDFPTGAYCIGGEGLLQAYETGKGKITLRSKCLIEKLDNGKEQIVITQIPYQVNKSQLLIDIMKLREEKKDALAGITEIVDESDKEGIRAVIRIKKDYNSEKILNLLYKYTSLQTTFGINMVAIADGKPQLMGLLDIISYYTNYQRDVVLARTKFELEEAKARLHIVEGLVIAVTNIDEVIRIIRAAASTTEAKQKLRLRFNLTDRQAQAILDLRLARLTKLEINKLIEERDFLVKQIEKLEAIVHSNKLLMQVVKDELVAVKKAYRTERATMVVEDADYASVEIVSNEIPIEETVLCIARNGQVKRCSVKNFALSSKDLVDRTNPDSTITYAVKAITTDKYLFFTSSGNCYQTGCNTIKELKYRDSGMNISEIMGLKEEEKVVGMVKLPDNGQALEGEMLLFTRAGMVKRSAWSEYALLKSGFCGYKSKEDDEVISVQTIDKSKPNIVYVTAKGMCISFSINDVPLQGRVAGGVKGMMLDNDDYVLTCTQCADNDEIVIITEGAYCKRIKVSDIPVVTRYRKGVKACDLGGVSGKRVVYAGIFEQDRYIALIDEQSAVAITCDTIVVDSRAGRGKLCKDKKKGARITDAFSYANKAK